MVVGILFSKKNHKQPIPIESIEIKTLKIKGRTISFSTAKENKKKTSFELEHLRNAEYVFDVINQFRKENKLFFEELLDFDQFEAIKVFSTFFDRKNEIDLELLNQNNLKGKMKKKKKRNKKKLDELIDSNGGEKMKKKILYMLKVNPSIVNENKENMIQELQKMDEEIG